MRKSALHPVWQGHALYGTLPREECGMVMVTSHGCMLACGQEEEVVHLQRCLRRLRAVCDLAAAAAAAALGTQEAQGAAAGADEEAVCSLVDLLVTQLKVCFAAILYGNMFHSGPPLSGVLQSISTLHAAALVVVPWQHLLVCDHSLQTVTFAWLY